MMPTTHHSSSASSQPDLSDASGPSTTIASIIAAQTPRAHAFTTTLLNNNIADSSGTVLPAGKPNAIVRPTRRRPEPPVTDSGVVTGGGGGGGGGVNHSALFDYVVDGAASALPQSGGGMDKFAGETNFGLGSFTRELDLKLRRLQSSGKKSSSKNSCSNLGGETMAAAPKRPLFVTTVPTGVFLQPTRELPVPPAAVRRTYAYFSIPRILTGMTTTAASAAAPVDSSSNATAAANNNNRSPAGKATTRRDLPQNQRIVRGSNYSQQNGAGGDGDKEAESRRRKLLRQRIPMRNQRGIIGTPPAVHGRKHEDVQTDKYLEELFARPPEYDAECQTDLFLQRPPSPPYVPAKIGVDVATEILEGELFNFDREVEPLLETLVGRSVEQGLLEVMHEEELADVRQQQQEFLAQREKELAELRRLEAEELRLLAEKERRLEQEKLGRELDRDMQERVTAAKLLQTHIADLLPGVLHSIEPYLDVENREMLERELGPWLANEVAEEVGQMIDSRDLLEELVRQILEERAAKYMQMSQRESVLSVDPVEEEEVHEEEEEQEQE